MTDKQAATDALARLPDDASLEVITEELRLLASNRHRCADLAAAHNQRQEAAEQQAASWATAWMAS